MGPHTSQASQPREAAFPRKEKMDVDIMDMLNKVSVSHLLKMCVKPVRRKSPSARKRDKARMQAFLEKKDKERLEKECSQQVTCSKRTEIVQETVSNSVSFVASTQTENVQSENRELLALKDKLHKLQTTENEVIISLKKKLQSVTTELNDFKRKVGTKVDSSTQTVEQITEPLQDVTSFSEYQAPFAELANWEFCDIITSDEPYVVYETGRN